MSFGRMLKVSEVQVVFSLITPVGHRDQAASASGWQLRSQQGRSAGTSGLSLKSLSTQAIL